MMCKHARDQASEMRHTKRRRTFVEEEEVPSTCLTFQTARQDGRGEATTKEQHGTEGIPDKVGREGRFLGRCPLTTRFSCELLPGALLRACRQMSNCIREPSVAAWKRQVQEGNPDEATDRDKTRTMERRGRSKGTNTQTSATSGSPWSQCMLHLVTKTR